MTVLQGEEEPEGALQKIKTPCTELEKRIRAGRSLGVQHIFQLIVKTNLLWPSLVPYGGHCLIPTMVQVMASRSNHLKPQINCDIGRSIPVAAVAFHCCSIMSSCAPLAHSQGARFYKGFQFKVVAEEAVKNRSNFQGS